MEPQGISRVWLRAYIAALMCCVASLAAVAAEPPAREKPAPAATKIAGTTYRDLVIGKPVVYKNLTIFPVSSKVPKNQDRFITLAEGLRSGKVKIVEVGAEAAATAEVNQAAQAQRPGQPAPTSPPQQGAQANPPQQDNSRQVNAQDGGQQGGGAAEVNRLMVINNSDKPLYLMPGEVISGGRQDRTIGQELVIQPSKNPVPIDVFCVEHGRWEGRQALDTVALVTAATQVETDQVARSYNRNSQQKVIADKAQKGEFAGSVGQLSKGARVAVQGDQDQTKVWAKVAENNAKSGAQTESGNFTANYAQKDVADKLKPYIEHCGQPVLARAQVVGVVVAINGKVQSVDIFESTPLFTKLYDKLLKSFALDAATAADAKDASAKCPSEACVKFLQDAEKSPVAKTEVHADLKAVRRESESVISFTAGDAAKADSSNGFGGGAFGGGVHTGAFTK